MNVGRIEVEGTKITLFAAGAEPEPASAFDQWKGKRNARPT